MLDCLIGMSNPLLQVNFVDVLGVDLVLDIPLVEAFAIETEEVLHPAVDLAYLSPTSHNHYCLGMVHYELRVVPSIEAHSLLSSYRQS